MRKGIGLTGVYNAVLLEDADNLLIAELGYSELSFHHIALCFVPKVHPALEVGTDTFLPKIEVVEGLSCFLGSIGTDEAASKETDRADNLFRPFLLVSNDGPRRGVFRCGLVIALGKVKVICPAYIQIILNSCFIGTKLRRVNAGGINAENLILQLFRISATHREVFTIWNQS